MERLKLRGRIVEKYGTLGAFAEACGVTATTVTNVLAGRNTPTGMARLGWLYALDIPKNEGDIFFYPESLEIQTKEA